MEETTSQTCGNNLLAPEMQKCFDNVRYIPRKFFKATSVRKELTRLVMEKKLMFTRKISRISMEPPLRYSKLRPRACSPKRATEHSIGYDIRSPINITVQSGTTALIPLGLAVEIPLETMGE